MTGTSDATSDVIRALKAKGFLYHGRAREFLHFSGCLTTSQSTHACYVLMYPDFSEPPHIFLKDVPEDLKPVAPHIGPDKSICYLARSTITLNIFDPVRQMLACIARAEEVLGQILRKEILEDLAGEFFSYWGNDDFPCYFDLASEKTSQLTCLATWGESSTGGRALFLSDDVPRTKYKAAALGYRVASMRFGVIRIKTASVPKPSLIRWPLSTVDEFIAWQRALDTRASRVMNSTLAQLHSKKVPASIVIVESPLYTYAAMVVFDDGVCSVLDLPVGNTFTQKAVVPLRGWRIDERYITQRNIPGMKTLSGKKIAIVGCGTIGGYLADLLIKAGAGTGGGKLTLVDSDNLHAQNLGRHILGFRYLAQNKAKALAHYFAVNSPDSAVRGLGVDARSANLSNFDLLIDATAEGALSNILIQKYGGRTPQLSVWIEGAGAAVGAHIRPSASAACAQCLATHTRNGKYRTTVEPIPLIYEGQGCEQDYVPFPASVSIQAACLASEMVFDWVAGKTEPTFRTRVLDRNFTELTTEATPERIEGCPACNM